MSQPCLESAVVTACSLEVPVEDFAYLPQELGCSLHRGHRRLTLASDQPGCAMHFSVDERGELARLEGIEVTADPEGRFFRDVVGLVLQVYSGDLEAELTWSPRGAMDEWVEIRSGETSHPLLFQPEDPRSDGDPAELPSAPVDLSLPLIEQWLDDATRWWGEYLRLKDGGPSSPEA